MIKSPMIVDDLLAIFQNYKGYEYIGSRASKSPKPERFKSYQTPYFRLKTTLYNDDLENISFTNGANLLEKILLPSFGMSSVKFYGHQSEILLSYPSAGGCYPMEIYLVSSRLDGVDKGVYYYSIPNHSFYKVNNQDSVYLLNESLLEEHQDADFYFIITAYHWRSCWKYSNRGYRFGIIETGHVLSNFQYVLKSLGLDFSSYTVCKANYLRTLLSIDNFEEPFAVIAVNIPNKEEQGQGRKRTMDLNTKLAATASGTIDQGAIAFDWTAILNYQDKVNQSIKRPSEQWLQQYQVPEQWGYKDTIKLLYQRRSSARYSNTELSYADFMSLTQYVQTDQLQIKTYAIVHAVQNMQPGVYHIDGVPSLIKAGEFRDISTKLCIDQQFVYDSSVLFFFAIDRSAIADSDYYLYQKQLIESGILSQNLYLKSLEYKMSYSAIGGYYDDDARVFMELPAHMEVIYAGTLGMESDQINSLKRDRYYLNQSTPVQDVVESHANENSISQSMIISKLYGAVLENGDRIAIRYDQQAYTYKEMWSRIAARGAWLKEQLPLKGLVGLSMKNCADYLFTYYGLLLEGYLPMLIDHTFTRDEMNSLCDYYHIPAVVSLTATNELCVEQVLPEELFLTSPLLEQLTDVATCRFSSGTTGRPKCLMFTEEAIVNAGLNWAKATSITQQDNVLCTALFHNGLAFNTSFLAVFLSGATLHIQKQITPKSIWEIVSNQNISILVAFPVVYDLLNQSKFCNSNHGLRLCLSSSAPLHHAIKEAFTAKVGLDICDYYGIVECGPCTFNDGSKPLSQGIPVPGVSFRIVDEQGKELEEGATGFVHIKSQSMSKGYLKGDVEFQVTPDGYYQTSDQGYLDGGYLYINGRTSDLINVAGKKVDPVEIENVLLKLEFIRDAAVVGVMNERQTTEFPVAYIVTEASFDLDLIIAYCQQYLAPFKLPQKIIAISEIPRSGVGKIKRKQLVEDFLNSNRK
ncbi:AMP-binding protein [Paenibacillus sp. MMS18-CY102]|uniref:AMP-binding protein n=1 Tax=Paenibacillus sp. MMS18-CY102 TaxID=2682849 RepID=UPI003014B768